MSDSLLVYAHTWTHGTFVGSRILNRLHGFKAWDPLVSSGIGSDRVDMSLQSLLLLLRELKRHGEISKKIS